MRMEIWHLVGLNGSSTVLCPHDGLSENETAFRRI